MPMIILAIRFETEIIFKMNYRVFLGNKGSNTTSDTKADSAKQSYSSEIIKN